MQNTQFCFVLCSHKNDKVWSRRKKWHWMLIILWFCFGSIRRQNKSTIVHFIYQAKIVLSKKEPPLSSNIFSAKKMTMMPKQFTWTILNHILMALKHAKQKRKSNSSYSSSSSNNHKEVLYHLFAKRLQRYFSSVQEIWKKSTSHKWIESNSCWLKSVDVYSLFLYFFQMPFFLLLLKTLHLSAIVYFSLLSFYLLLRLYDATWFVYASLIFLTTTYTHACLPASIFNSYELFELFDFTSVWLAIK